MAPGSKIDQSLDEIIKSGGNRNAGGAQTRGSKGKGKGKGRMTMWEEPRSAKGKGKGKGANMRSAPFVKQLLRAAASQGWGEDNWSAPQSRWGARKGTGKGFSGGAAFGGKGFSGGWAQRSLSAGARPTRQQPRVLRTIMKPSAFQAGRFGGAFSGAIKKLGGASRPEGQWSHDMFPGNAPKGGKGGGGKGSFGGMSGGGGGGSGSTESGLVLSNLDYNVTARDVLDHFGQGGAVQLAWVEYDRTDRSMGTGGVILSDRGSLQRLARMYHGQRLGELPVEVHVDQLPPPSRQAVLAGPAAW